MKKLVLKTSLLCLTILFTFNSWSQSKLWTPSSAGSLDNAMIKAPGGKYFDLDFQVAKNLLDNAPNKNSGKTGKTFHFPDEYGNMITYKVFENTTMSEGLQSKFPEIRTFDAINKDENYFAKIDYTPHGFHAIVHRKGMPTLYIDPVFQGNTVKYIVYNRNQFTTDKTMDCQVQSSVNTTSSPSSIIKSFGTCELRTYDLAVAATGEYTAFHGGTLALAQAAQVTTINRVNSVYEIEIAITLTLIPNNDQIVYTDAGTDPYSNGNTGAMINENQTNIDNVIGFSNYDIGHVFGTNSGGLAGLGVVCSGSKARGVTGSGAPVGDPFDIDYVCHEMGHQFNANHTQNNGCNRNNATAVEPGSASTIMGYAGICAPNVQSNSDDHFHGVSLQEIDALITSGSHTCPTTTPLANNAPSITSTAGNVTIPANTPFALTAVATDPDGDPLSYCWEQMDNDVSTQPPNATSTGGPNFRSNSPISSPTRYFPNLTDLYNGGPFTWEVIPSVDRTMDFRVTVRDNAAGGGGCNDHEDLTITVEDNAGPFIVQYPNATGITWNGFDTETVTWDVANTDQAPVSCATVDIRISTDGGTTWTDLATNVANDGSHPVTVPNSPSTTCLVMVICSNGTFFDISDNYFTINAVTNDFSLSTATSTVSVCQGSDATYSIDVNELGTFTNNVTLSTTGLPGGLTANFTPNPVTPGNSAALVISNTGAVAAGSYSFDVEGTSTTGTKSIPLTLDVTNSTVSASTLTAPADGATGVALPVTFNWTNGGVGVMYDIEIATDPSFSSIVESATGLTNETYNATTLSANTSYYWRVNSYNSCASGGLSSVFSFTTESCSITMSTDIPVTISASGTPTITSTITIGTSGLINDIDVVDLIGQHTYVGDLIVTLESPSGTTVELFNGICNNLNDFDLNFDDDAPAGAIPCPPTTGGSFQPNDALSAFNGEDQQGVWTLTIEDTFNQDGGSLDSWGLNICITPPACTDPDLPSITADASICEGESITLEVLTGNLNDATDWEWYSGSCGGTSEGNGTSISVSPTTTTTYFVRGEGGCVTPGSCESVTITVTPLPTPAIAPVADLCEYASAVTLVGTPVTPSLGTFSGTGVSGNQFDPSSAGAGTHTITYDFTDANGCSNTATTDITVNSLPTPTIDPVADLCESDAAITLVGTPSGGTFSGPGVSGGNFDPSVAGIGAHTISYDFTDANGCSGTGFTVINVVGTPTVDAGLDVSICNSDAVTLTANNPDGASISWDNGVNDGIAFNPTATNTYTVTATIGSCSSTDQVSVTVLDNPTFTVTGTDPMTCGGSNGAIAINGLDASSSYSITYDDDGTTVGPNVFTTNGAGNITINGLDAGTYNNFIVENGAGCSGTVSASTVLSDPGAPTVGAGTDVTVCEGSTVTLTANNPDGATISWDNGINDGSAFTPSVGTTTYTVTADLAGCTSTDEVDVTTIAVPTIGPVSNQVACDVYTLPTITGTNLTGNEAYYDAPNGGGNMLAVGAVISTPGTQTLYIYDATSTTPSCSDETSFTVTINQTPDVDPISDVSLCSAYTLPPITGSNLTGNESYFDGPNGTGTPYSPGQTISNSMTMYIYDETGSSPNCSDQESFSITITGGPSIDAGNDFSICEGNTATLTAVNPDGASLSWDNGITDGTPFSPTTTTTYTVTANLAGCVSSDQVTVTVNTGYTINNSASICQGGTYTFPDGSTATSSTTHTSSFTTTQGCDSIIVTTLTVTPAFNTSETAEICDGDTYTFPDGTTGNSNMTHTSNLVAQGGCDSTVITTLMVTTLDLDITFANNELVADQNNATYQWVDCENGNTPIAGATDQVYEITQTGSYACIITLNGCTDTSNCINAKFTGIDDLVFENVNVYPNPTAHDITIDFGKIVDVPHLKVMDARGRLVYQINNLNQDKVNIPLQKEANGMYIIEIVTQNSTHQIKVLKQR